MTIEERIKCPYCGKVQDARVILRKGAPFADYTHKCEQCGKWITESEWNIVDEKSNKDKVYRIMLVLWWVLFISNIALVIWNLICGYYVLSAMNLAAVLIMILPFLIKKEVEK